MSTRANLHRSVGVLCATALLLTAGGLAAIAAPDATSSIPTPGGKVRFCYNKTDANHKDGGAAVRIYDTATNTRKCASGDKKLDVQAVTKLLSGQVFTTANYTLTAAYTAVPSLAVVLPAAGTYAISGNLRGVVTSSGGATDCYIEGQLALNNVAVPNSVRLVQGISAATAHSESTAPISQLVTVTGPTTLTVQAQRSSACTHDTASIGSDVNGVSSLSFVKIA